MSATTGYDCVDHKRNNESASEMDVKIGTWLLMFLGLFLITSGANMLGHLGEALIADGLICLLLGVRAMNIIED